MENGDKKPEEKQADRIYLLLVFAAFIVAVMAAVSIYSDKGINIYVVSAAPETEHTMAASATLVSDPAGEQAGSFEPKDLFEKEPQTGEQEILMEKSVDINRADQEELEKLPGIGPVLAERIIEYRTSYGDFYDIEEVMEVSGIGEKILEKIEDFIYVSQRQ